MHQPSYALLSNSEKYEELKQLFKNENLNCIIVSGLTEISSICQMQEVDMVVAGIVGSAGMEPVIASVTAGKDLLLANKEAIIVAGELVMKAAALNGANIIPLDSEHNAIYQCLPSNYKTGQTPENIEKIILTASGGPFWNVDASEFPSITPQQACAHPNWDMGRKISVDSATLMNKGLEVIEAHWLFNLASQKIDVHVHPQSIIHSMVCYKDGSVLAQLGEPDMRIPIAYGLGLRERISSGANLLDLLKIGKLEFYPPDFDKFPCLNLAKQAIECGGTASLILNAANEVAVEAFLNNIIQFNQIALINKKILESTKIDKVENIQQLMELDYLIRQKSIQEVKRYA
jgi:1-deoxy-D-xylulose-5-phosphate reductoisomerase